MSDAMIEMLVTCLIWVAAYLVVLYITKRAGVGYNVLRNSLKWMEKLKKKCASLKGQLCSKGFSIQSKGAIRSLRDVVRCEKGIARILTVYLFDNKGDKDVSQAMELLADVPEYCRKAVAMAVDGKSSDIDSMFCKVYDSIDLAVSLVKKAIDRDLKEELLKV